MRQIKFKFWDSKEKEMWGPYSLSAIAEDGFMFHIRDFIIPLQFTGLLDKNGKEIFEGDILHFNTLTGNNMYYEVKWKGSGFKPTRMSEHNKDEIEIIGNIYENPNLLTK